MRVLSDVWYHIGSSVCARHPIHVSWAWVIFCSLPFPHLVLFRVFLLSLHLLHEPGLAPLPLPCGRHRDKIPLALRQMRSLALWPITYLSQLPYDQRGWIDVEPCPFDKSCFEVSQKMIRLLRHDSSVTREEDGAVEFRILAQMFRSESTCSPHWIRAWPNYLQKGGGLKKRFLYCVDPFHADIILYLRATQGHSGQSYIARQCVTGRLRRAHLSRWKLPWLALNHPIWVDSRWQRRQERETRGALYDRESNVHRPLSRKGLRRDTAQKCSVQTQLEHPAPKHSVVV